MRKDKIHSVYLGEKYGLWTIAGRERYTLKYGHIVRCKCICGTEREVIVRTLTTGKSKSCGCYIVYKSDRADYNLNVIWMGIPILDRERHWKHFTPFKLWALRTGYKYGATLERHKPNQPYSPDNCFWAPKRRPRSPWLRKE